MAKAYACDRCGELFKQSDYEYSVPIVLENNKEHNVDFGDSHTYVSLCPKCRASFQKWWDTDAVHKTTDYDCSPMVHTLYEANEEDKKDG